LDRRAAGRYLLASPRDEIAWRYEVVGRDPRSDEALEIKILERASAETIGYVCYARDLSGDTAGTGGTLRVYAYELSNGVSWLEANTIVLDALAHTQELTPVSLTFVLAECHPLQDTLPDPPLYNLDRSDNYSFYVRVPDLPAFLRHVAPALESRLASSVAAGHTSNLKLGFYDKGLHLEIVRGRIKRVEHWNPTPEDRGDATFPYLSFLQLLFGYRSLQELDHAFADCSPGGGDTRALLQALFPKRPTNLQPIC
jgi:hypothetical protein